MANRFPLILDADAQRIKELASGDNLDLTGNDISAVRNIIPESTETYDLGSTDKRWRDLFLSGQSVHLGDGVISYDASTNEFSFSAEISGSTIPANLELNGLTVNGDLTVNGSMTTINTSTLVVEDKNVELAVVTNPTDTTADGGGITIKGTTDKLFRWISATSAWTSSEHLDLAETKSYKINGTDVLSSTALGSGVVTSSLTSVGALNSGSITSGFGSIDIGESVFTGDGSGLVNVDADLLEGQDGNYYLDYQNFTNVPTDLSDFNNDENFITLESLSAAGDLSYDNETGQFSVTTYKSANFDADFAAKTTDGLSEGTTNLYFTQARARDSVGATGDLSYDSVTGLFSVTTYKSSDFDTDFAAKTTDGLSEGSTNLYFTQGRARDSVSASGDLNYDSATGVFSVTTYKSSDFDTDFAAKTTDGLSEGTTNLYFTTGRIDSHLTGGTGVSYSAGTISIGQAVGTTDNVTFNDLTVSGAITSVDSVQFDTSITYAAPGKGKVVWNEEEGSLDVGLEGGVVANLPEETLYRVENKTGATIQDGTLVVAAGTVGNSGKILVAPWNPSVHSPVQIMGLATEDILDEGTGYVTHFGKVRGIQTNGANYGETWSNFDILYASPLGGLTNVPPAAPNTKTIVALVINAHPENGTLFVRPTLSSDIGNDDKVQLSSLTNGDLLIYNSSNGRFENGKGASITGNAATATALQTVRQINGTNFDGTADITTANWGTGRTVTIGLSGKEVNGGSNVSWTLSEIGAVAKAGDTMTGYLTLHADPDQSLHAATKKYVDEVAQGLKAVESAFVLVDSNLSATYDPDGHETGWATLTATANGVFPTTDGVDTSELNVVGARILLTGQTNKAHNGLYVVKVAGNGSTAWVLRRCQQCYQSSQIPGTFVFVKRGTNYANTGWVATVANVSTFTVGTDDIDYVQFSGAGTFTAGSGLVLDGTVFSHANTSNVGNLASDNSGNTFIQDISFTFDTFGHVTAASVQTGTVTVGDGVLTVNTSGTGLSGSGTFSANQGTNSTITITSNATAQNTASAIVARDASGNFAANTITAALSGNASSATALQNARTIGMTGDVTWTSATFDGTANVTGTSTLANSGVTAGTYGSATQIPVLTVDAKGRVTSATESSITVGNGTLTLATSGIATGSQTFTANQGTNVTFTVDVPGTNIAEGTRTETTVPITSSTGTGATLSAATTSLAGVMSSADKTKLDGIAAGAQVNVATNLGYTAAASTGTVTSSTGTSATLPAATTSLAGLMTGADKTKLDGIAANANNYSLPNASTTVTGGVRLGSDTAQTVAANAVTATAARTYAIQVNASGQMLVNVPWVDTNTTYSAGNGISLSGTTFIVGAGTGLTQEASGLALTAITAGNATVGALRYNSTTRVAGQMYGGTTNPSGTTRLNYDGHLHVNNLNAVGDVNSVSDERLKTNWRPVQEEFLDKVLEVKFGVYDRIDTGVTQAGVSAQDWQKVLPETVNEDSEGMLSVNYGNAALVTVIELTKLVKQLQKEIEELKSNKN